MPGRDFEGVRNLGEKAGKPLLHSWRQMERPVQDDGFSCGIIALNVCEKELWPQTRLWESATKDFERIEFALLLATGAGCSYSLVREISLKVIKQHLILLTLIGGFWSQLRHHHRTS